MAETLYDPANDELPDENSKWFAEQPFLGQAGEQRQKTDQDEKQKREERRRRKKLSPALARLAGLTADVARERFEEAARSMEDFLNVVAVWDRMDVNRERRERYREVLHGDLPPDCKARSDAEIIPCFYMNPAVQQLRQGYYLDVIFDCPYEMHQLTANAFLSQMIEELSEEHKEILYFLSIRLYSTTQLAQLRSHGAGRLAALAVASTPLAIAH